MERGCAAPGGHGRFLPSVLTPSSADRPRTMRSPSSSPGTNRPGLGSRGHMRLLVVVRGAKTPLRGLAIPAAQGSTGAEAPWWGPRGKAPGLGWEGAKPLLPRAPLLAPGQGSKGEERPGLGSKGREGPLVGRRGEAPVRVHGGGQPLLWRDATGGRRSLPCQAARHSRAWLATHDNRCCASIVSRITPNR